MSLELVVGLLYGLLNFLLVLLDVRLLAPSLEALCGALRGGRRGRG